VSIPSPVAAEKANTFTPFFLKMSISFLSLSLVTGRSVLLMATTSRGSKKKSHTALGLVMDDSLQAMFMLGFDEEDISPIS
jgi:hypothetical protein